MKFAFEIPVGGIKKPIRKTVPTWLLPSRQAVRWAGGQVGRQARKDEVVLCTATTLLCPMHTHTHLHTHKHTQRRLPV